MYLNPKIRGHPTVRFMQCMIHFQNLQDEVGMNRSTWFTV